MEKTTAFISIIETFTKKNVIANRCHNVTETTDVTTNKLCRKVAKTDDTGKTGGNSGEI